MPRLSAEYKKQARKLILENLDRFIKRYFDDDRTLITRQNDYKRYGVLEKEINGEWKLFVSVSRTSFQVCDYRNKYYEDFIARIFANVNGIDIVCRVDLQWKNNIIGGQIISQFGENFRIYERQIHRKRRKLASREEYCDRMFPDVEFVDFDFHFV